MTFKDDFNIIFFKEVPSYRVRYVRVIYSSIIFIVISGPIMFLYAYPIFGEFFFIFLIIYLIGLTLAFYNELKRKPNVLIKSAHINNDKLVIYYYFKGEFKKITLDVEESLIYFDRPPSMYFYWWINGVRVRENEGNVLIQSTIFRTWRIKDCKALVKWWEEHQKRVKREKKANQNKN